MVEVLVWGLGIIIAMWTWEFRRKRLLVFDFIDSVIENLELWIGAYETDYKFDPNYRVKAYNSFISLSCKAVSICNNEVLKQELKGLAVGCNPRNLLDEYRVDSNKKKVLKIKKLLKEEKKLIIKLCFHTKSVRN